MAPQVLGALVRRYGNFSVAEDAVQEALLAAAVQWPEDGSPDNPRAWLITVASRRMTDMLRAEQARRRREDAVASWTLPEQFTSPAADAGGAESDDTLILLLMCCHPALSSSSQIALTLRAVGGLTTGEIANAFLAPEPTMAQRISRAKQRVKDSNAPFSMPPPSQRAERTRAVLHVLYLIFNEGYASTSGAGLQRVELSTEAIRLARMAHAALPDDGEVAGLLALMLLTDARRPARVGPDGELIPLDEQDRTLWDGARIREGVALVTEALSRSPAGPYQVQAAIAAVHDEAESYAETDWPQILALYGVLTGLSDNPVVRLNRAVAAAMVHGPRTGLDLLDKLELDKRMSKHHRLHAVRAHLLERAGDTEAALDSYRVAAKKTASPVERRYLLTRAARLAEQT
ncbi:MAG: RNA polymerase sigma factor [Stackebrandtia sp.]